MVYFIFKGGNKGKGAMGVSPHRQLKFMVSRGFNGPPRKKSYAPPPDKVSLRTIRPILMIQ